MSCTGPEVAVRRPVYQLDELQRVCDYSKPDRPIGRKVTKKCQRFNFGNFVKETIPLVDWLPKYNWRKEISGDLIAGATVAVMHIPQGMAYALLATVPPIVGIYMAFFPVLIYLFLGTSKHNSMGSFALICLMTGKVVSLHSTFAAGSFTSNGTNFGYNGTDPIPKDGALYSPMEVATAVTFAVGIIQLAMYLLQLGVISTLLSDTLISGFTTAAAIHVATSQIKDLFGLEIPKRSGIFKIVMTYVDVFNNIENLNVAATVISAITILVLTVNNEVLKGLAAKKCTIPIPIEMLAILLGTILSVQMNLARDYSIAVVGNIPVGLPSPAVPPFELIPVVLIDSAIITMVSYTTSISMALIFAQRNNYEIDSNQELMAQGVGNVVGSLFSCLPFTASLSRSSIQEAVGGRSQLASLVSCGFLLCVLLWIGPFFEPLPRCILASIIVVALKGVLIQITQFYKFWRLSRTDAAVWMITFLTVVFLDIEYGLLVGMLVSLISLLLFSMRPYVYRMGVVPGTEIYLDVERYKGTVEFPGVKMLHYCGGLNFASRHHFRNEVYKVAGVSPVEESARRSKLAARESTRVRASEEEVKGHVNAAFHREDREDGIRNRISEPLKILVLDFSALTHVDPAGVATLRNLVDDFEKIEVAVYITGCSGPVYETMKKCNAAEGKESRFTIFPTVGDAVNFALHESVTSVLTPVTSSASSLATLKITSDTDEHEYSSRL